MNIEDKITHLQNAAMEEARAKGNSIIERHKSSLKNLSDKHEAEAKMQMDTRIKSETIRAKQQLNQATAKAQIELKRELGKYQRTLKIQLFDEVHELLNEYKKTDAYKDLLVRYIHKAATFAKEESLSIYVTKEDEGLIPTLTSETGMELLIHKEDFYGGIRAVIHGRNILMDYSFKSALESEFDKFQFLGGGASA